MTHATAPGDAPRESVRAVRDDAHALALRLRVVAPPPARAARDALPVVLVHGYGVSSAYWMPLARRLGVTRRVYAPDLPGHGRSARTARALAVDDLALSLLAAIDSLNVGRAVLVGQSLGAQVALEAAVRAPARVAALVLVGPSGDPRARTRWRTVLRAARTAPFERLALLLVVARDYLRAGPRFVWEEMTRMLAHHPERVLPRVAVPALVLRGARDAVCSAAWAREVAARLPAGEARTIPHAAHAVHWTRPDAVAAEIEGFLRDRA